MNNKLDQEPSTQPPENFRESVTGAVDTASSRRKFTRQAVVGSAVLFSLSNRPVWSTTANEDCVSVGFLNSVGFASGHPDAEQKLSDVKKELRRIERRVERGNAKIADRNPNSKNEWVLVERNPETSFAQVCKVKQRKSG